MGPPSGALKEEERYDEYHDPSAYQPKFVGTPRRKRPAAPSLDTPTPKRSAVAAKKGNTPRKAKPAESAKPAVLVLGPDFGTTFTGLSYAFTRDGGKIRIVTDWNVITGNSDDPKTPSAINFDHGNVTWGSLADQDAKALRWFKLLLVNECDLPEDVRASAQLTEARRQLSDLGMSAVDVIASYLEHFWAHCLEKLKVAEGEETVDSSRLHIVMTLPAIWPNYARDRMRQAVEKAGILRKRQGAGNTSLEFLSEPEAGALSALWEVDGRHNIKASSHPYVLTSLTLLQVGDSFVIVDCGGGTVDLISYIVTKINPLEIQEIVRGQGALCGAMFVDERFLDLLKQKLRQILEDALDHIEDDDIAEMINRHWTNGIRRMFTGEYKEWVVRVPFLLAANMPGVRNPTFTITSDEIEEIFRPTVEKIQALVYVILVGGFGRCKYLHEYLKRRCLDVEVLQRQGFEPWSAISRGAVIHGLAQQKMESLLVAPIKSRIARASYGTICEVKWDEEKHDPRDYFDDEIKGEAKATRQMKWNILRDQAIDKSHLSRYEFVKYLIEMPETIVTDIYMSKAEDPPTRRDESVMLFCKITWDINVNWNALDIYTNNQGEEYRTLLYAVEMKCIGGQYVFHISHKGKKQAAKHVSVEVYENSDI